MKLLLIFVSILVAACAPQNAAIRPAVAPLYQMPLYQGPSDSLCPTMAAPVTPVEAARNNTKGTVVAKAKVVHGLVESVNIVSGPEVYHEAVIAAFKRYRCQESPAEFEVTQTFDFKSVPLQEMMRSLSKPEPEKPSRP